MWALLRQIRQLTLRLSGRCSEWDNQRLNTAIKRLAGCRLAAESAEYASAPNHGLYFRRAVLRLTRRRWRVKASSAGEGRIGAASARCDYPASMPGSRDSF